MGSFGKMAILTFKVFFIFFAIHICLQQRKLASSAVGSSVFDSGSESPCASASPNPSGSPALSGGGRRTVTLDDASGPCSSGGAFVEDGGQCVPKTSVSFFV